jgi:hypothetical protein
MKILKNESKEPQARRLLRGIGFLVILFLFTLNTALGQGAPPPPPAGGGEGGINNQRGGGAPIGSGTALLLVLGAAYAGRKAYRNWKNNLDE